MVNERANIQTGLRSGGIVAGIIGGIAMAMVAMFVSAGMGQGFWAPLYLIGATFFGVNALVSGASVAFVGLLIHVVVSAMYGLIFALLTKPQTSIGRALLGGLAYGTAIWLFMTYAILPWANPTMSARVAMMSGWFFIEHLVYGGVLSITPALRRGFAVRAERVEAEEPKLRRSA